MTALQNKTYTINIGVDDFKKMATSTTLFVDKTSFISTLLGSGYHVTLITRPRRWGKTLNMTMLQYFFGIPVKSNGEIDEEEQLKRRDIFSKLKIGEQLDILKGYCGKYPVIFISFKDTKPRLLRKCKKTSLISSKNFIKLIGICLKAQNLMRSIKMNLRNISEGHSQTP